VEANFGEHRAKVKRIDLNAWGVMHILHTFTGVRIGDTRNQRDWVLTTLWVLTMDGLALGLIVMVLTSLFMWWRIRKKRLFGFVALTLGVLLCGLFAVGLKSLT
jgi:hypothetical protein